MARVTVEDCIDKVENRFDLVLLSAHRARLISGGAPVTVERDRDKNPVVALREIADETISAEDLREEFIHSLQKYVEVDEPETDEELPVEILSSEEIDVFSMQPLPEEGSIGYEKMDEAELLRSMESLKPPSKPRGE